MATRLIGPFILWTAFGLVGGKARARKLSKAQRVKIAKAGANARWRGKTEKNQRKEQYTGSVLSRPMTMLKLLPTAAVA